MLNMPSDYAEIKKGLQAELVELMDKVVLKHTSIPQVLDVTCERHTLREGWAKFIFRDPRFPENDPAGTLRWDYGSGVNSYEFVVRSNRISNAKFSAWNREDHHSVRTKDPRKALKAIMQYVVPYRYAEVAALSIRGAKDKHERWVEETSSVGRMFDLSRDKLFEELENLLAQGVKFKTEAFTKAVGAMDMYKEYLERRNRKMPMICVMRINDKVVLVKDDFNESVFDNDEQLPESTRSKLGLLKLVDEDKFIPEVGYRVDSNIFWIYTESNN